MSEQEIMPCMGMMCRNLYGFNCPMAMKGRDLIGKLMEMAEITKLDLSSSSHEDLISEEKNRGRAFRYSAEKGDSFVIDMDAFSSANHKDPTNSNSKIRIFSSIFLHNCYHRLPLIIFLRHLSRSALSLSLSLSPSSSSIMLAREAANLFNEIRHIFRQVFAFEGFLNRSELLPP